MGPLYLLASCLGCFFPRWSRLTPPRLQPLAGCSCLTEAFFILECMHKHTPHSYAPHLLCFTYLFICQNRNHHVARTSLTYFSSLSSFCFYTGKLHSAGFGYFFLSSCQFCSLLTMYKGGPTT
jgi:hypothetical protein